MSKKKAKRSADNTKVGRPAGSPPSGSPDAEAKPPQPQPAQPSPSVSPGGAPEDRPTPQPQPGPSTGEAPAAPAPSAGTGSVVSNAWTVGVWTVLSRLLGLYRFRLMADIFGASGVADAFNFAFVFPNLTRRLFGEGLLTSAFVPVFSSRLAKNEKDAANRTGSVLLCRLAFWLTASCVLVMILAGVARVLLPRVLAIDPRFRLELELFQWLLPYLVFINAAAVLMAILNSLGHFRMPALAPVLLNILMIAACAWVRWGRGAKGTPDEQIWLVAYAVLLGGLLQFLIQIPPAFQRGFNFRPSFDARDPGYCEVMGNFKPVVLMMALFQLNVMMDNVIAQVFIPEPGPVTYLNMGTSVYQLPWSIFSLALGTAALPELAKLWAQSRKEDFVRTLLHALRVSLYWAVPCTVGIVLLSQELVRLLYGAGRFLENDAEPVRRTAGVVLFSSLGLVFYSVNAMLARALYAMKDMKTPTTTLAWSAGLNFLLNLFFVVGLAHLAHALTPFYESLGSEHPVPRALLGFVIALGSLKESGLALASTLSNAWQTALLLRAVRQRLGEERKPADSVREALSRAQRRLVLVYSNWTMHCTIADGLAFFAGLGAVSACIGVMAYRWALSRSGWEGFLPFFAAVLGSLVPFIGIGRQYFKQKLLGAPQEQDAAQFRYGVKDEHWPEELKFCYSFYSTVVAAAVMGFLVWAVRDSLPPEGPLFAVLQRGLVPVAVGVLVYCNASSSVMSVEYEELKKIFWAKLGWR
ncbi:MAG: murein biosynthesis integral membrane protein MurJ [Planctomycetota bacterium]